MATPDPTSALEQYLNIARSILQRAPTDATIKALLSDMFANGPEVFQVGKGMLDEVAASHPALHSASDPAFHPQEALAAQIAAAPGNMGPGWDQRPGPPVPQDPRANFGAWDRQMESANGMPIQLPNGRQPALGGAAPPAPGAPGVPGALTGDWTSGSDLPMGPGPQTPIPPGLADQWRARTAGLNMPTVDGQFSDDDMRKMLLRTGLGMMAGGSRNASRNFGAAMARALELGEKDKDQRYTREMEQYRTKKADISTELSYENQDAATKRAVTKDQWEKAHKEAQLLLEKERSKPDIQRQIEFFGGIDKYYAHLQKTIAMNIAAKAKSEKSEGQKRAESIRDMRKMINAEKDPETKAYMERDLEDMISGKASALDATVYKSYHASKNPLNAGAYTPEELEKLAEDYNAVRSRLHSRGQLTPSGAQGAQDPRARMAAHVKAGDISLEEANKRLKANGLQALP